jgi:hypothetical protein
MAEQEDRPDRSRRLRIPTEQIARALMLKNATYNLMETAAVLSKGLHRYETFRKDGKGCRECGEIWKYMQTTDEEQLNRILAHLRPHVAKDSA